MQTADFTEEVLTVNPLLSAAALFQNSDFLVRRLFEGGAYSKEQFSGKSISFIPSKRVI